MRQIQVEDDTYDRLSFAANVFGVTVSDVVTRLVRAMDGLSGRVDNDPGQPDASNEVTVHVVYQGQRVEGVFDQVTNRLQITSGKLSGENFSSPSAAAIAVVEALNPGRTNPQTNGRTFWIIDRTGRPLRSIMGRRTSAL